MFVVLPLQSLNSEGNTGRLKDLLENYGTCLMDEGSNFAEWLLAVKRLFKTRFF